MGYRKKGLPEGRRNLVSVQLGFRHPELGCLPTVRAMGSTESKGAKQ